MNMKHRTLINRITAVVFGLLMLAAGMTGVFAENDPVVTEEPIVTVPVTDEPIWTDPPTDPPTEPPTVPPTEPVTEVTTEAPTQATTATGAQETTEKPTENGGYINVDPIPTEFVPPTIPKTVSNKNYTTNVAAGIISRVCVIVGLIVIFAVIASTKLSGYRAGRRV